MKRELTVTVHLEDDAFWATVEELPGVFATGDTLEELRECLAEGIALYLSEPGQPVEGVRLGPLFADAVAASGAVELALT